MAIYNHLPLPLAVCIIIVMYYSPLALPFSPLRAYSHKLCLNLPPSIPNARETNKYTKYTYVLCIRGHTISTVECTFIYMYKSGRYFFEYL